MSEITRTTIKEFAKRCGVKNGSAGLCPSCNRIFAVDMDNYAAYHAFPMCDEFETKDPVEYIQYLNRMYTN